MMPRFSKPQIDALGVDIAAHPFFIGVYDYLMLKAAILQAGIVAAFIGHETRSGATFASITLPICQRLIRFCPGMCCA